MERPRKEMAMTAGGSVLWLSQPTVTTVIATHINIKFSAWFRNVFYDFTIGFFPSSTNAVSFSSARTTNRFPSSRCASAIQIVRLAESIAKTQLNADRLR
jgi:hypothetical protein